MGLAVFPYIDTILSERRKVVEQYDKLLDFSKIQKIKIRANTEWNYSYYPIIFKDEITLLKVQEILNQKNIFPRRYFYPSLNTIEYVKGQSMPISEDIASRIMCLPLYVGLELDKIEEICFNVN